MCLGLLGRFGITASFGAIDVYSAELFPTALRNTGLAVCSVGSRFGGILAPMLQLLVRGQWGEGGVRRTS